MTFNYCEKMRKTNSIFCIPNAFYISCFFYVLPVTNLEGGYGSVRVIIYAKRVYNLPTEPK
jgi:hypothetical protein